MVDEAHYPDGQLVLDWNAVEPHEGEEHPDDEIADHSEEADDGS